MKNLIRIRHLIYLVLFAAVIILMQSCAVYAPYASTSVPLSDILQMSKDGMPAREIVKHLRDSHSIYFLKADQLAKLSNEGVSDTVINYMEKTHINAVARNQRYYDSGYWGAGWDWYGSPAFGWPGGYWGFGWGPSIVFEDHDFHGRGGLGYHGGGGGFHGGGGRHH